MRSGCTSTSSSGSTSTPPRCPWCGSPPRGRTCCRPTPTTATWRGWRRRDDAARPGPGWSVVAPGLLDRLTRVGPVPVVHSFDPPERFVAVTVGAPGERTFFLQAREGARVVSVALEKQQVVALAERMDPLLDELMKADTREVVPAVAPLTLDDADPLEQPIVEESRAGTMTLSWDPDDERVVIEVFPFTEAAVVSPDQLDEDIE